MDLTLGELCKVVEEELGRSPSKGTSEALVNEAGERWVNSENWRYLRRRTQEVTLTPGVEFYRLGAGVHSIGRTIHRPNSVFAPIELKEWDAFTAYKERYLSGIERPYHPVATTLWGVREDAEGKRDERRTLYLSIFPASVAETVVLEYRCGWIPLDGLSDTVDMPSPLIVHFRDWVRVYALHREFPESYPMGTLDRFMQSTSFTDAQRKDAESVGQISVRQGNIGDAYQNMKRHVGYGRYKAMQHWSERGGFN